ncbi:serine/threonine protein kinase [Myxococcus eversor]|uniref:serine/threonine protein kinase n=1 Tax=Myxococcus eversor TaxID=2709661 RepID=UPI001F07498C|nr:serine/threonine-protein kinase [Myxococcus eversor]
MVVSPDMGNPGQTQFGRYELLERLGAGGMAEVYRARYPAAPGVIKSVVIKRVLGVYASDPEFAEMFLNEARICVRLSHGNVVQVFDFGEVDGEYFLAMEWVDGQPLSRVLKRASAKGLPRLPTPIAAGIAIDMCRGLHYAHTLVDEQGEPLGLVHRDISPDNVLMSFEGEVKISDFGIAKARLAGRVETEAGVVKGKYLYLSPEQARGEVLDARSDVYAVGVVLYQMLCGQLPNEGDELEVMTRTVEGRLTPARQFNPTLDAAMLEILQRALMKSRDDRYRTTEALQQALSDWLSTNAPLFPTNTRKHLTSWLFQDELATRKRIPALPSEFLSQLESWRAPADVNALGPRSQRSAATRVVRAKSQSSAPHARTSEPPGAAFELDVAEVAPGAQRAARKGSLGWRWGALIALVLGLLGMGIVWRGSKTDAATEALTTKQDNVRVPAAPEVPPILAEPEVGSPPVAAEVVPSQDDAKVAPRGDESVEASALGERKEAEPEVEPALDTKVSMEQEPPALAVLRESGQSFNPIQRAHELVLEPTERYSLRTLGTYGFTWSKALDGTRAAPSSSRVLAFIADPEVPPERRLWTLTTDSQTVTGITRMWLFVLWGQEWALTRPHMMEIDVRSLSGGAKQGRSLNVVDFASELAPEHRFTVRNLRPGLRYAVEIRASHERPRSPVVMIAVPAAPFRLRVAGQPSDERLHVLDVGRHILSGASELWFSLPRWADDAEVEMEVSVEAAP